MSGFDFEILILGKSTRLDASKKQITVKCTFHSKKVVILKLNYKYERNQIVHIDRKCF